MFDRCSRKSVDADVVAWVLERATNKPLAELASELIWKKITKKEGKHRREANPLP